MVSPLLPPQMPPQAVAPPMAPPGPPMGGPPMLPPGLPPGPPPGPPPGAQMGPDPSNGMTPGDPPDPMAGLFATIAAMDPMALRVFLAKLKKKERDVLVQLAGDDEELSAKLLAAMPLPKDYEPERPRWYKKPPKPDVATLLVTARRDYNAYLDLRTQFKDDFNAYMNRTWGRFKTDQALDPASDDSAVFVATALASEVNMRAAMLAEHEVTYQVPAMRADLLDETRKEEAFLHYVDDLAERRHARRGGGSLKYDVAWNFQVYGRAIMRRVLDLADCEDPFDEVLIDPLTCCPIWGGKHGLLRVTRWFSDEIAGICRDYDVDPKVVTKPKGTDPRGNPFRELSIENTVNVIEWWDENWYGVYTEDGRPIKPLTEHKLGEVPFVVQLVSRGLPPGFTDPAQRSGIDPSDTMGMQRKNDLKLKGLSAVYWLKFTHRQREAIVAKIMDALVKSDNPPIWLGMDTFSKTQPVPKLGTRKGRVYTFDRDHHQPQIPQYAPLPPIVQPLMESLSAEWGMGALPQAVYAGDTPSNTSGAALDGLTEGGMSKLTVDALAMQHFFEARAEQTLRWWKDWGRLVEDAEGRYGVFSVPLKRRHGTGPSSFELTPDVIERGGTRVKVKLTNLRLGQLGAVGAAFMQLVNSPKPLMSARNAMERLGWTDPDAEQEAIDFETMRDDQRIQDLRKLEAVLLRTGEPIDPKELAQLQAKLFAAQLMAELGQGGGGGGAPGSAPPPQGGPGMGPPPVSAGVDQGDYGSPPGANGAPVGRPPGMPPDVGP